MPRTIDDLRALVKERIDDTSYKTEGVGIWSLLLAAAGIISYMISCDRYLILCSLDKIAILSSIYLLLLTPFANILHYIDTRDLYRKEKATLSTFFPNPFIGDNIAKVIILSIIFVIFNSIASKYMEPWKIYLCLFTTGIMIGIEWSSITYKMKYKQELFPAYSFILIFPIILTISVACLILPDLTFELEADVIRFSLSLTAGVGILYYGIYIFYLSPKTQMNNKLRNCYNRLLSRESLDLEEEHKRFLQTINGFFIDELYEKDLNGLHNERKVILGKCIKANDLLNFRDDFSMEALDKVSKANNLIKEIHQSYSKQVIESKKLIKKIEAELKRLPQNRALAEQSKTVMNSLQLYSIAVTEDFETFDILIDTFDNKIQDFRNYYKKHIEHFCKYAPYKRRFGHFIGCRIIPKIENLFREKGKERNDCNC